MALKKIFGGNFEKSGDFLFLGSTGEGLKSGIFCLPPRITCMWNFDISMVWSVLNISLSTEYILKIIYNFYAFSTT
jgi:hypothetical protein